MYNISQGNFLINVFMYNSKYLVELFDKEKMRNSMLLGGVGEGGGGHSFLFLQKYFFVFFYVFSKNYKILKKKLYSNMQNRISSVCVFSNFIRSIQIFIRISKNVSR